MVTGEGSGTGLGPSIAESIAPQPWLNLEEGSRAAKIGQKDLKEGEKLLGWLELNHSEWISLDGSGMHLAVARQLRLRLYVAKGAAYCQKARTSVTRYEAFCARNVETIPSGPYPPTEEKVAWYLLDALDRTRDLKKRTGKPFKGSSGKSAEGTRLREGGARCTVHRGAAEVPAGAGGRAETAGCGGGGDSGGTPRCRGAVRYGERSCGCLP